MLAQLASVLLLLIFGTIGFAWGRACERAEQDKLKKQEQVRKSKGQE